MPRLRVFGNWDYAEMCRVLDAPKNRLEQDVTRAQKAGFNLDRLDEFLLFVSRVCPGDLFYAMVSVSKARSWQRAGPLCSEWRKTMASRRARASRLKR